MRTFIQIDVQNLFFSAKDIKKRINFLKIKEYFQKSGDKIVGLYAYIIRTPDANSVKFERFLLSLGYNLIIKEAIKTTNREGRNIYRGTDQDTAITIDCMRKIKQFDKWVLMSGDGDFIDLCKYLKKEDKAIDVWALKGSSFNKKFCDYVDSIHFFNNNFLYDHKERGQGPVSVVKKDII